MVIFLKKLFNDLSCRERRLFLLDKFGRILFLFFGFFILVILFLFLYFLITQSFPFFQSEHFKDLYTSILWKPVSNSAKYGVFSMVYSTLLLSFFSLILVLPISLGIATLIVEYIPTKIGNILRVTFEVLSALPSVIIGFIGLVVFAPLIKELLGLSSPLNLFTAGLLLAFFVLPSMVSMFIDVLSRVSSLFKEASFALGASKFETILKIVYPSAFSGIVLTCLLILARIMGETMIVLMLSGNSSLLPSSIFSSGRTLTSTIAIEMGEVGLNTLHYHALFMLGLILFFLSSIIQGIVGFVFKRSY